MQIIGNKIQVEIHNYLVLLVALNGIEIIKSNTVSFQDAVSWLAVRLGFDGSMSMLINSTCRTNYFNMAVPPTTRPANSLKQKNRMLCFYWNPHTGKSGGGQKRRSRAAAPAQMLFRLFIPMFGEYYLKLKETGGEEADV